MERSCICQSCGLKVELQPGEMPCQALKNWFVITRFQETEQIGRYSFCSLHCLKDWVESEMPRIPEIFLRSMDEEDKRE